MILKLSEIRLFLRVTAITLNSKRSAAMAEQPSFLLLRFLSLSLCLKVLLFMKIILERSMAGTHLLAGTLTFSLPLTKTARAGCPPEELNGAKAGSEEEEEGSDEGRVKKAFYL